MNTLWMCKNAIYPDGVRHDKVWCAKGFELGYITAAMVQRGNPLVCKTCNPCIDSDIIGEDIRRSDRGWG